MSSTWASVVPAGTVPKDYPRLLDGLSARPVASVSRRSPRSRANRGPRAGFLGVGRASWSTRASTSRSAPDTATRAGLNSRQGRPSRDPPSCGRTDWKTLVFGVLPLALRARPVRRAVRDEGRVLSPAVVAVSVSPCSTVATEDSAPVSSARTFTQADWPTLNGVTVIHGFEWHRGTFSFDELTTGTRRAGVGAIVGAQSRTGRERLRGSSPPDIHHKPDSGRPRRPGPAPIRASEGLRAPVAMVVSPRPERAGQADQDGRPSGAALTAINLSVVRGVGSSTVVPRSVGAYRPVIAGAKLREGTTTILPRGRALQGVGLSSDRLHPSIEDPVTTKTDNECGLRWQSYSLSARPSVDRLRRA